MKTRHRESSDDDFTLDLLETYHELKTAQSVSVFGRDTENNPARYPIAAVLPQSSDMYRPHPDSELADDGGREWRTWRDEASKFVEQRLVLIAMAQYQADTLDVTHGRDDVLDCHEVSHHFPL